MRIAERYRRLTSWNKLNAWGAAASIVAVVLTVALAFSSRPNDTQPPSVGSKRPLASNIGPDISSRVPVAAIARFDGGGEIEVIDHGFSEATYSTRQRDVHVQRGLRQLSELESGRSFSEMPKGTFGFVESVEFLIARSNLQSLLPTLRIHRFSAADRFNDYPFEVETRPGHGAALLGFCTETGAAAVSASQVRSVVLSARPRGDFTTLVSIGTSKVAGLTSRLIEAGRGERYRVMDIEVR